MARTHRVSATGALAAHAGSMPVRAARKLRGAIARCLAVLACAGVATTPGCFVYSEPEYVTAYEPLYYDGHVVYYDTAGAPIYFVDGVLYDVPRSFVRYHMLVEHYRRHAPAYRQWYHRGGYRRMTRPVVEHPRPPLHRPHRPH